MMTASKKGAPRRSISYPFPLPLSLSCYRDRERGYSERDPSPRRKRAPSPPTDQRFEGWPLGRVRQPPQSTRAPRPLLVRGLKAGPSEGFCRRFNPGGSLDRRVNCRRVSQPRWVGARRSMEGGREQAKGNPAAFVLPCAQVGCACSRGLQASAWERARALHAGPFSRAANLLVREPWTFLL
jgi:hypothetical protein